MAVVWSDVVLIAPELATTSTQRGDAILADVALEIDSGQWGKRYDVATKYLAAHVATMINRRGIAGAVTGETVGPVSRQFAAPPLLSPDALAMTTYGIEFLRLRRLSLGGSIAVT